MKMSYMVVDRNYKRYDGTLNNVTFETEKEAMEFYGLTEDVMKEKGILCISVYGVAFKHSGGGK